MSLRMRHSQSFELVYPSKTKDFITLLPDGIVYPSPKSRSTPPMLEQNNHKKCHPPQKREEGEKKLHFMKGDYIYGLEDQVK